MTREEALEVLAKERGCAPGDLSVCENGILRDGTECSMDPCPRYRELLAQPTPDNGDTKLYPQSANPKTLMGNLKVPNLSVVPFTGLIHEARAMEYGARHAPRKDGGKGYGPFNWRDQNIEYLTYAEAAIRHIASAVDREDIDPDTGDLKVWHLALAKATLGILIDAIEHGTVLDNRPKTARGRTAQLLRELRKTS